MALGQKGCRILRPIRVRVENSKNVSAGREWKRLGADLRVLLVRGTTMASGPRNLGNPADPPLPSFLEIKT